MGSAACEALGARHELIRAGRSSGDVQCDITDADSIDAMYRQTGRVDAVVCATGHAHFGPLAEMTAEQFMLGLTDKVMGQVNVVLRGLDHVNDGGSFTLTSGVLDRDPIRQGANASTANAALAGFVSGASIEMPRGLRINVVSPGLLEVSAGKLGHLFPGHDPVSSRRVDLAFAKSVEGPPSGQVIRVD
ncbi:MAG: short chain dehydrogenase [Gammaproteobacteria bacterium]|nr:short chain dehydrogenase [Gammaproteobacteria bacterium]